MRSDKTPLVKRQYLVPFVLVTSLFFMWGFARAILDVLNKHFQDVLDISITQSSMIQVTTYLGYFLMALPAGAIITRFGYRRGVVLGLLIFGIGSLLFIPSNMAMSFSFFLIALFVIGCGLVLLETAANPYITELGDKDTAASRLNFAQSFNGLGCIIAPAVIGSIVFKESESSEVAIPYTVMGIFVLIVALAFTRFKLPEIYNGQDTDLRKEEINGSLLSVIRQLLSRKSFLFGLLALFCYEISEISINSLFINYVTDDGWMTRRTASLVLSFGALGAFMCARILGSWLMSRIRAELVLLVCAVMTVAGSFLVILNLGDLSHAGLFICYAFEAIMFPTIFAICVSGLGNATKTASSILMMTPIGGAVGTYLMGVTADATSMSFAFIVPFTGYLFVLLYAAMATRRTDKIIRR